jgi:hypothetical protein
MQPIFDEIFKALGYLMMAGIIVIAWKFARDNATEANFKMVLFKGFLWCAGIALFASATLGSPTCEESSDPVYGGCEQYADDDFEPSTEQQTAKFAYYLTLLYVPVLFGVFYEAGSLKID